MSENENKRSREDIFVDWKQKWGSDGQSPSGVSYKKIDKSVREEALDSLVQTLLQEGYSAVQIKSESMRKKVIEETTSDYSANSDRWKQIVNRQWNFVLTQNFGDANKTADAKKHGKKQIEKPSTPSKPVEVEPSESPAEKEVKDDIRIKMPSSVIDEIDLLAELGIDDESE